MWLPMNHDSAGVKYRANMLALNRMNTNAGLVKTRAMGEWSPHTIHSRSPHLGPLVAGKARSASVKGPPRTSSIGASMARVMCCTMCRPSETWE